MKMLMEEDEKVGMMIVQDENTVVEVLSMEEVEMMFVREQVQWLMMMVWLEILRLAQDTSVMRTGWRWRVDCCHQQLSQHELPLQHHQGQHHQNYLTVWWRLFSSSHETNNESSTLTNLQAKPKYTGWWFYCQKHSISYKNLIKNIFFIQSSKIEGYLFIFQLGLDNTRILQDDHVSHSDSSLHHDVTETSKHPAPGSHTWQPIRSQYYAVSTNQRRVFLPDTVHSTTHLSLFSVTPYFSLVMWSSTLTNKRRVLLCVNQSEKCNLTWPLWRTDDKMNWFVVLQHQQHWQILCHTLHDLLVLIL